MGGIDVGVVVCVETASPHAFRTFSSAQHPVVIEQQIAQVVAVTASHIDDFSQNSLIRHFLYGKDFSHEEGILQRKKLYSFLIGDFLQRGIFILAESALDFESHVAVSLNAFRGVGNVKVPGGGDENQVGLLLVEHHLVGFLALIEGCARRYRIPAAVDVGDTDNLEALNRAQQSQQLFAPISESYQCCLDMFHLNFVF